MKEVGRNAEVIKSLFLSIHDGLLERIEVISESEIDGRTQISLDIKVVNPSKYTKIRLVFNRVLEFGFYNSQEVEIYIEELVFFITNENKVYISLDPYDSRSVDKTINDQDNYFILSEEVIGYAIEPLK